MGAEIPGVDDTSYQELVEHAKNRIAARTDEWTDFNPHDPGVTILELLAWLTDTYIYEADQLTDRHRRKYLQLLGSKPAPPQPASVALELSPTDGGGRLPAGTRLRANDGSDQATFETDHPLSVTDSNVAAVVINGQQRTTANETDGMYYRLFGDEPTPGDWFAVGFDGDPFDGQKLRLFVDFYDSKLPEPPVDDSNVFEPSVELSWEYCRSYPPTADDWEPLEVDTDGTNSLYEGGYITFEQPEQWEPTTWGSDEEGCFSQPAGVVWIRCRLIRGGYEIPPQCTTLKTNVVTASHRCAHDEQLTPTADGPAGAASRTYQFEQTPVLAATVYVDGEQWTEIEGFDGAGPTDCHYVLDRAAGELTVGDGKRGALPPAEATVRATYEAGGGTVGNVSKQARWSVDDGGVPAVDIEPLGPATGGSEAESLEAAIDRCRETLQSAQRAVTADDYGTLAESTPGVRVARSTVRPPEADGEPIAVVVVPYAPPDVQCPTPSDGFIQAVKTHLDRRRLLGDRIDVRAPSYVELTIELSVVPTATHSASEVRRQVDRCLRSYLDPIAGFEGDGWPFGQSVSKAKLQQRVRKQSGVKALEDLSVRTVGDATVTTDGRVLIDETALFVVDTVVVDCSPTGGSD